MHPYWKWLPVAWLLGHAVFATAVSNAPIQALVAYIESPANRCSPQVIEWNREYSKKTVAGEIPRSFYYRVLGYQEWGECGRPYFRPIFNELNRVWVMFGRGIVSEAEFEAKEAELINLFFAAARDKERGESMVREYQNGIAARLIDLDPPRQFFNCTFFGDQYRCLE